MKDVLARQGGEGEISFPDSWDPSGLLQTVITFSQVAFRVTQSYSPFVSCNWFTDRALHSVDRWPGFP